MIVVSELRPPQKSTWVAGTGTLPHLTRQEAQGLITAAGGRVTSSVTRKTDYVVAGTDPGSKYEQAQRLEIPVLTEEEFYHLLRAEG